MAMNAPARGRGRPRRALAEEIADGPVLLDGGLATLLEAHGHDLRSALWSARLLVDDPGAIVAAHREFFGAGARVAITASYQANFTGMATLGLDHARAADLMRLSVRLARQAADEEPGAGDDRWVAASIGPYGAALADGSEYRGDYGLSVAQLRAWHRPRLRVLADAGADVLAIETIPCRAEVEALVEEIRGSGCPAWLSLTCAGSRTRAGEPLADAFAMAAGVPEIVAVGVNCSDSADVAAAIDLAVRASGKPGIAYPNSGERWDAVSRSWSGAVTFGPEEAAEWIGAGARLVGGCCRVGPGAIRSLADALPERER